MRFFSKILLVSLSSVALAACSTGKGVEQSDETIPVETLYNQGANALEDENYKTANQKFEEVERLYPYSEWAIQAQLMAAYASYKDEHYDEAIIALDRFVDLHPGNSNVAYARYLKALSFYDQITDVKRDQFMTEEALKSLDAVIKLHPETKYARDAALKRDLVLDHLAGKEMEIGRYYLNRSHVNAAINRFLSVVKNYQTTTHVAEALHRLVESYLILGLKDEATRVAAVLGHNYPGSPWYKRSYNLLDDASRNKIIQDRGIIDRTIDSLFKPS